MNRGCDIPLESYRLARYSLQVPCYICDGPNVFDTELCRHCQAPMALRYQTDGQKKTHVQMVALLGSSGVGKTVYLGMLMDMLSRDRAPLQVLARGAFSISLQQATISALTACEFPEKTPNEPDQWKWIHCVVKTDRRRQHELIMPDMAGEAILEEIEHPNTYPVIRALLTKSAGVLLLLDAISMEEGDHEQEHFAMKVATFLSELGGAEDAWRGRPMAIVLTKADQSDSCMEDPRGFVEEHAPGVWRLCSERFDQVDFFASGVAGACAYRTVLGGHRIRVPLRIEPRGICEPFQWLVERLPR